MLDNRMQSYTV